MKLKYYIRKSLKRTKNAVKKNRAMKINKTYRKQKKKKPDINLKIIINTSRLNNTIKRQRV